MPDSTTSNPDWLTNLLNAVVTIWGMKQSGQTPNFYPAPLTPQEQWKTDASKSLFDLQSGYAKQFLQGTSNLNPDYKLNTSEVGNPAFMGGVHVPTFDVSKLNFPSSGASAPTTPQGKGQTGEGSGPTGVPGDPFGHVTSPAGGPGDPFAGWPDASPTAHNVTWADIQKYGPEAVKYATSLLGGGMPLAAIIGIVAKMFGHGQQSTGTNTGDFDFRDASQGITDAKLPEQRPTGTVPNIQDLPAGSVRVTGGYYRTPSGQLIQVITPGSADYKPVTTMPRDPGNMYDPGSGISAGIVQPEGQGMGQGGFGPGGWSYDKFLGGGQHGFGSQVGGGGRYKP